jgi:hypothetical protein
MVSCSVDITPIWPTQLFGYAGRSCQFSQIAIRLEANILCFISQGDVVSIVQLDTLFPSEILKQEIQLRITRPIRLVIVASHTHFAPALDNEKPLLGKISEDYLTYVAEKIAGALNETLVDERFAGNYIVSRARCDVACSRRKRTLKVGRRFPYIAIETAALPNTDVSTPGNLVVIEIIDDLGRLQSVLWNWACHPVASPKKDEVSADYVGFVRDAIRQKCGQSIPVVFLPGFSGDLRPFIIDSHPSILNRLVYPLANCFFAANVTQEEFERFSQAVAKCVCDCIGSQPTDGKLLSSVELCTSRIPLATLLNDNSDAQIPIARLCVANDLQLLFVGAEVSNGYDRIFKETFGAQAITIGYYESVFGYLPLESQVSEGGYEVTGFMRFFGVSGRFLRGFQGKFMDECEKRLQDQMVL